MHPKRYWLSQVPFSFFPTNTKCKIFLPNKGVDDPKVTGSYVSEVLPGFPMANAGIKEGKRWRDCCWLMLLLRWHFDVVWWLWCGQLWRLCCSLVASKSATRKCSGIVDVRWWTRWIVDVMIFVYFLVTVFVQKLSIVEMVNVWKPHCRLKIRIIKVDQKPPLVEFGQQCFSKRSSVDACCTWNASTVREHWLWSVKNKLLMRFKNCAHCFVQIVWFGGHAADSESHRSVSWRRRKHVGVAIAHTNHCQSWRSQQTKIG